MLPLTPIPWRRRQAQRDALREQERRLQQQRDDEIRVRGFAFAQPGAGVVWLRPERETQEQEFEGWVR
jgi:hypothetical protein